MLRGKHLALLLLGACGAPSSVEAPSPHPPADHAAPSATLVASSAAPPPPRPNFRREDFRDPDAKPEGAIRRFGSKRLHALGYDIALLDNGWLVEDTRIWRPDGHLATVSKRARFLGQRANELALYAGASVQWVQPDGTSLRTVKLDCDGSLPWLSADGRRALCRHRVSDSDRRTRVFDAVTGERVAELALDGYSQNTTIATAGDLLVAEQRNDDALELVAFDLATGKRKWRQGSLETRVLTLSPDGSELYRLDGSGQLMAHDAHSGTERYRLALPPWQFRAPLRVSPHGKQLVVRMSGPGDDTPDRVGLIDLETRRVSVLATGWLRQAAFSPRGTEIAMEINRDLIVVDVETKRVRNRPEHPHRRIEAATVYGDLVVSVSRDGVLKTWDRETGEPRLERKISDRAFQALFLRAPRMGALPEWQQVYRVFDVTTGAELCAYELEGHDAALALPGGEVVFVENAATVAQGKYLARVTVVGPDCAKLGRYDLAGQVLEAELTPDNQVELMMANPVGRAEPTHFWRVRIQGPTAAPREIPGSRVTTDAWSRPEVFHTPATDGEPFLRRADGGQQPVASSPVVNPASPVAVVAGDDYRDDGTTAFAFRRDSGQMQKRLELPPEWSVSEASMNVDDTGRWLTVIDGASVVLYDLKPN